MRTHRILMRHTDDGWSVHRPGWPSELTASREWAECLADSIAHESYQASGCPACVVLADGCEERVLRRFG